MNEQWYWQLAQDRQRELLAEAQQERLLKEAGVRVGVPAPVKWVGLALLVLPWAVKVVRGLARI